MHSSSSCMSSYMPLSRVEAARYSQELKRQLSVQLSMIQTTQNGLLDLQTQFLQVSYVRYITDLWITWTNAVYYDWCWFLSTENFKLTQCFIWQELQKEHGRTQEMQGKDRFPCPLLFASANANPSLLEFTSQRYASDCDIHRRKERHEKEAQWEMRESKREKDEELRSSKSLFPSEIITLTRAACACVCCTSRCVRVCWCWMCYCRVTPQYNYIHTLLVHTYVRMFNACTYCMHKCMCVFEDICTYISSMYVCIKIHLFLFGITHIACTVHVFRY